MCDLLFLDSSSEIEVDIDVDGVIEQLLSVRKNKPGKAVQLN